MKTETMILLWISFSKSSGVFVTEKDATDDFVDVGHSDSATELMQKYFVGEVDNNTLPAKPNYRPPPPAQAYAASDQSSGSLLKILQFVVPLLILGVAFALQYYGKKTSPAKPENWIWARA